MFISVIVVTMLAPVSETFFNSNDGYRYEEYISVYPFMVEGSTSYSDKEYDKYSDIIKEFIEKISLMDGNISMDLELNVSGGATAQGKVYFSLKETPAVPLEKSKGSIVEKNGVYVGNKYVKLIDNDMISIFNDNYSVLGVAATKKLEKNECIYIKYSELNDAIKEKINRNLCKNVYFGEPVVIHYESNNTDMTLLKDYLTDNTYMYEITEASGQSGYNILFGKIKNILLGLTGLLCIFVIGESVVLLMSSLVREAFIKEVFGMSRSKIYVPVLLRISLCFVAAAIVGLLVVYVIFKEILVIRFWLLATAFLLVVTFVIFGFSYLKVDRRRADRAEQILRFTE